jgi:hypothetical protein
MCGNCEVPSYPTRSETVEHPLLPRIVSSLPHLFTSFFNDLPPTDRNGAAQSLKGADDRQTPD